MLTNGKAQTKRLAYMGCSCHNTKQSRRAVKKMLKRKEEREWKRRLDKD